MEICLTERRYRPDTRWRRETFIHGRASGPARQMCERTRLHAVYVDAALTHLGCLAQAVADFEDEEVVAGFCVKKRDFRILPIDDAGCFFLAQRRVVEPQKRRGYCVTSSSTQ